MSSAIYFFIHWAEVIPSSAWRVCTSGRPSRLRGRFVSQTAASVFRGGSRVRALCSPGLGARPELRAVFHAIFFLAHVTEPRGLAGTPGLGLSRAR